MFIIIRNTSIKGGKDDDEKISESDNSGQLEVEFHGKHFLKVWIDGCEIDVCATGKGYRGISRYGDVIHCEHT